MITLVLGGARSGKSAYAESLLAARGGRVTYVATIVVGDDADLAARVRAHQGRRPAQWVTLEAPRDVAHALATTSGPVLIDSLGPWVAGVTGADADGLAATLCQALRARDDDVVVVSEEVGLGVHPSSEAGRAFRDALGTVNQAVAAVAHEVVLVVAGQALRVKPAS
ncbi:MAG: bifunctional adenosylcobinamide kinase/adenosylcobinamide-phosphate guanylyltransferase [Acidimicrobiales bacterium]